MGTNVKPKMGTCRANVWTSGYNLAEYAVRKLSEGHLCAVRSY
jgi:hypothetical protein